VRIDIGTSIEHLPNNVTKCLDSFSLRSKFYLFLLYNHLIRKEKTLVTSDGELSVKVIRILYYTSVDGPRAFDWLSLIIDRSQWTGYAGTDRHVHSVTIYHRSQ